MSEPPGVRVRLAVLTSGGDAPGMNAALRAVVRTALARGAEPFAVHEGLQGLVDGGSQIRPMAWDDVADIQHRGGTLIGTARSKEFRTREGRRAAAGNLVAAGIDRLVVIGGDGSLTGAALLLEEWPSLLAELVEVGELDAATADRHQQLQVSGMVGSIDNDMVGFDMTIGADSALHRIVDAIDAITSTAASHQRSFVIEVMGRRCGYLAVASAVAGGCDAVFVPEDPAGPGWQTRLCDALRAGRAAGRRDGLVVVAEGAVDLEGNPIRAQDVAEVMHDWLGEDVRVTTLGHVQRGGTPSAFDRWMSTLVGHAAALEVIQGSPSAEPTVVGLQHSRVTRRPLHRAVAVTRRLGERMSQGRTAGAIQARGTTFTSLMRILDDLSTPPSAEMPPGAKRVGLVHVGGLSPGMNSAVYAAVRLGMARGMHMLGVSGGLPGLAAGRIRELSWEEVDGWITEGGAMLGTARGAVQVEDLYAISRAVEEARLDALMIIGGVDGYLSAAAMLAEQTRYPMLRLPVVCVPASVDNNLPGTDLSIGADTALGVAVDALDRIKQSAGAEQRCFIVELMGRTCGYLTTMAAIAAGAERVYLHETGVGLADLQSDTRAMRAAFEEGRGLFLLLRNEEASPHYTVDVLANVLEAESDGLFDVRTATLGHVQQGGRPSPFDRNLAVQLVSYGLDLLHGQFTESRVDSVFLGTVQGSLCSGPVARVNELMDAVARRPAHQWWLSYLPVLSTMADPPARSRRAEGQATDELTATDRAPGS